MVGAAMGGAVIVSVKLPVAVPAAPVAEIEMLGNEAGLASKGTVPEITPVVVFRNK
jgi:hypothetical protein